MRTRVVITKRGKVLPTIKDSFPNLVTMSATPIREITCTAVKTVNNRVITRGGPTLCEEIIKPRFKFPGIFEFKLALVRVVTGHRGAFKKNGVVIGSRCNKIF
jgi:hypothetical protein